jgi:4-amino-4-deoxy-L-arabinose transferase-like glycosyltransferase
VQTNQSGQDGVSAKSLPARIGVTILVLATLYLCYFGRLGAVGFVGNEARYASIARAMADTGDWVTPRLYGQGWFEKPPLYYWSAALSFKLFGVSAAAARLPCALYALLATLALAWLALRLYGAGTVRWMFLFFPVTVAMIAFSHDAVMDMPFSAMLTVAMVCAAVLLQLAPAPISVGASSGKPHSRAASSTLVSAILFGCFLGLAALAKGPAALVLCGGAVFLWALLTRRWRDAFRLLHPAAILAFCLTALPWYVLCARRNPSFFAVFIVEHNFKRYFTPEFEHIRPFWYYIPVLLLGCLPWSPAAIWAAVQGSLQVRKSGKLSAHTLFLVIWPLVVFCFFSFSRTKMPGYILPAVPPLILLLARVCDRLAFERRKSFAATLVAVALAGCVRPQIIGRLHLEFDGREISTHLMTVFVLAVAASNVLLAAGVLYARKEWARNLAIPLSGLPILFVLIAAPAIVRSSQTPQLSSRGSAIRLQVNAMPLEAPTPNRNAEEMWWRTRRANHAAPRSLLQVSAPHEVFVHAARGVASFSDGPDHQRLSAPHVAGREYAGNRAHILGIRRDVASGVESDAELFDHSLFHRPQKSQG